MPAILKGADSTLQNAFSNKNASLQNSHNEVFLTKTQPDHGFEQLLYSAQSLVSPIFSAIVTPGRYPELSNILHDIEFQTPTSIRAYSDKNTFAVTLNYAGKTIDIISSESGETSITISDNKKNSSATILKRGNDITVHMS